MNVEDKSVTCENKERLAEEKAEQACWQARIRNPKLAWFKQLVINEFFPTEQQQAETTNRLIQILTFAAADVPYYRDLLARLKLSVEDITSPEQLFFLPEVDQSGHSGTRKPHATTGSPLWTKIRRFACFIREYGQARPRPSNRICPVYEIASYSTPAKVVPL